MKSVEPFKTVLSGDREAMAKLSMHDLVTDSRRHADWYAGRGIRSRSEKWLETAKHPRWKRPYTDLTYQPMLEVLQYLRANGFKTYIVTGGGQDFVRVYSRAGLWHPSRTGGRHQGGTKFGYDKDGKPILTKEPKLLLNDDNAGKPEGIHLMIGRRPHAAFGNSTGDRQMLEYTGAGDGARLDDAGAARRCRPRIRLRPGARPARSKFGTFTAGTRRRGEKERLDSHQHEERLEAYFCLRIKRAMSACGRFC